MSILRTLLLGSILLSFQGCTTVHQAAERGDIEAVRSGLAAGMDVNAVDGDYLRPLIGHAAIAGQTHLVDELIARGADVNRADRWGQTPLYLASWKGHHGVVRQLLDAGADLRPVNNGDRTTALHVAARYGYPIICTQLIDHATQSEVLASAATGTLSVGKPDWLIEAKDKSGWTPLHWAAREGHTEVINVLLRHGADPDVPTVVTHQGQKQAGWTALHLAAYNDERDAMQALIEGGANPLAVTGFGDTPQSLNRAGIMERAEQQRQQSSGGGFQWGKFAALATGAMIGGMQNLDAETQTQLLGGMIADSMPGQEGAMNFQAAGNQRLAALQAQSGGGIGGDVPAAPQRPPVQHQHLSHTCPSGTKLDVDVPYRTQACLNVKIEFAKVYACNDVGSFQRVQQNCQRVCGSPTCDER